MHLFKGEGIMFGIIGNYKNLFVADFSNKEDTIIKIIFSKNYNFSDRGNIIYPFAEEVKTGYSILVSNKNHVKKLKYYVNRFGFPKKYILDSEKEKQQLVVDEIKQLRKLRRI